MVVSNDSTTAATDVEKQKQLQLQQMLRNKSQFFFVIMKVGFL
jgi:hypothetical protein